MNQKNSKNIKINPKLCIVFNSAEQYSQSIAFMQTEEIKKRIYRIFLPLEKARDIKMPDICGARLPYVIFDSEKKQAGDLLKSSGVKSVLIDNIGHIGIAKSLNLEMFGDFGLNVTNSYTLDQYKKMGISDAVLSPELNFAQIRDISKCINCGIFAYGRMRLMISENLVTKNRGYLPDKTSAEFYACEDYGHRNIIYNSFPVYLADKKELYKNIGLFFVTLNFTDENPEQIKKIIFDYASDKDGIKPPEKFTRMYK